MSKSRIFILLLCLAGVLFFYADAQERKADLVKKRDKVLKEIEYTSKLLSSTEEKKGDNLQQLKLIEKKISQREQLIAIYSQEVVLLEARISEREETIKKLSNELNIQKKLYADFIYYAYKNYNNYNISLYILASANLNQFYLRQKYMEQLKDARKKKIELIKLIEKRVKKELATLQNEKSEKELKLHALQGERKTLSGEKKFRENTIVKLTDEEAKLKATLKEKKRIESEIAAKLEELIKAETKRGSVLKMTPEMQLISDDFAKNKGRLPWPTKQGIIIERFGEHPHPVIPNFLTRNNGIDITTANSEQVRCIFDGEVSKIFAIKGANYTVIIRHGLYYSVYHNLTDVSVKVGDKLKAKSIIAKAAPGKNDGNSVVHLEIWKGLDKLDPEQWISN